MKNLFTFLLILVVNFSFAQSFSIPTESKTDNSTVTLGMRFIPNENCVITGVKFYRSPNWVGETVVAIWEADGKLIDNSPDKSINGWVDVMFTSTVYLEKGKEYVVTYSNINGWYNVQNNYFPKTFEKYSAPGSRYVYSYNSFPTLEYQNSNYFVEPILENISSTSYALILPETGGKFMADDSTTLYKAIHGAAPPHERLKDDTSLIAYRFTRSYVISGVSTSVRFTLYKTGAWIREKKNTSGIWKPF